MSVTETTSGFSLPVRPDPVTVDSSKTQLDPTSILFTLIQNCGKPKEIENSGIDTLQNMGMGIESYC